MKIKKAIIKKVKKVKKVHNVNAILDYSGQTISIKSVALRESLACYNHIGWKHDSCAQRIHSEYKRTWLMKKPKHNCILISRSRSLAVQEI